MSPFPKYIYSVTTDSEKNIIVADYTSNNGGANAGLTEGFFSKYDSSANLLFSKQLKSNLTRLHRYTIRTK